MLVLHEPVFSTNTTDAVPTTDATAAKKETRRQIAQRLGAKVVPQQKPGRSKQDYRTPPAFIDAAQRYLAIDRFAFDLAASPENAICPQYYTAEMNALIQQWWALGDGWLWCNPPFANLGPWVEKAYESARARPALGITGARIAMLLPASVGANWWRDWVHDKGRVLCLNGRLTFVGETAPYPKDCALVLYGPPIVPGYECWSWQA